MHRFYQLDLADMYRGELTVRKVSVLVSNLPRGAQVWAAVGGRSAITAETEATWLVEHTLMRIAHAEAGGKGKPPEQREFPPGILEMAAKAEHTESSAARFRAKHHK